MQITGTQQYAQRTVITVEKPTTLDGEYLFNSPYQIDAGSAGWAYRFGVVVMIGAAPSAPNVSYQPIVDSWEIEEGGGPFTVFGEYEITPDSTTPALIGRFAGGGGIGGEVMWFTILEVLCPSRDYVDETTLVVQWDRYTGACGKEPPDAQYDGTYYVYPECGEDLDGQVADDLIGTKGKATYFRASADGCDPRWIIDLLCHLPECL
jgi:hypothetical protein